MKRSDMKRKWVAWLGKLASAMYDPSHFHFANLNTTEGI